MAKSGLLYNCFEQKTALNCKKMWWLYTVKECSFFSTPRFLSENQERIDSNILPDYFSYSEKGTSKHIPFSELGLIPVYWSEVRCRGDEENILLCEKDIWQDGICPQNTAAAVTCSSSLGKKQKKQNIRFG